MDATAYSLADFYIDDSDDPFEPSAEFVAWRKAGAWATEMYLPALAHGPRTTTGIQGFPDDCVNLASYNYLGLAHHPEVTAAARAALDELGAGACGSPLLSGMTELHTELEEELADFMGRDAVMLFNSGFAGALGIMAGSLRRGDVAILDERAHVSLAEGARLSGARVEMFRHNDPSSLDAILEKHDGLRRIVVVEGVYSMDGDMGDLAELLPIAEKHRVSTLIDEAHSILLCGPNGRGVVEHKDAEGRVALQYGTFSKAFGGIGGFVAGDQNTIDYLRFFANSYAFSCALPPASVASNLAALRISRRHPELREKLADNASYFRTRIQDMGLKTGESESHVVPIIIGNDRRKLYDLCRTLREHGVFIAPVDFPSVPEDSLRFRASLSSSHTREELDRALRVLESVVVPGVAQG